MKKLILSLSLLVFIALSSNGQTYLEKKWDHTYGGIYVETLTELVQTSDGGFILGGFSNSDSSGEVSQPSRGGYDYWIVKTDSMGSLRWETRFGGDQSEKLYSVLETFDGGYLLGGFAASDSGADITEPSKGGLDYWIVKIDSVGNKLWDKRYGGTDSEWLSAAVQTPDSGFVLAGFTFSDSSGDVSQTSNGGSDFWIIKIDVSGNKLWDKRFGGNSTDELNDLQLTSDNGFILGGLTASDSSGDITKHPRGFNDYWILKTDENGNKLWENRFGGNLKDNLVSMQQTSDGGYILGGYSWSDIGLDITEPSRDTSISTTDDRGDAWLVKTDSLGAKMWDKRFGGDWVEDAFGYVTQTHDGGFLIGCASYSNLSGDKTENNFGYEQSWLVKTDSAGNKLWDKTIFVGGEDEYAYPIETSPGCYVIANWSEGHIGGYKTNDSRGGYDYFIIKFCETTTPQLPVADFTISNTEICQGGCFDFDNLSINSGTFLWLFPGSSTPSSTMAAPTQICYPDTGTFSVTLIASTADASDTLEMPDLVRIYPISPVNISQIGDSLFVEQGYVGYQWYLNDTVLLNDTNYYVIALQDGDYVVNITDSNNCPNSDTLFAVHVGIKEFLVNGFSLSVYPNPARNEITIEGLDPFVGGQIRIIDPLGKTYFDSKVHSARHQVQLSSLPSGIYFIEVFKRDFRTFARFIKE